MKSLGQIKSPDGLLCSGLCICEHLFIYVHPDGLFIELSHGAWQIFTRKLWKINVFELEFRVWTAATLLCGWTYESLLTMLSIWEQWGRDRYGTFFFFFFFLFFYWQSTKYISFNSYYIHGHNGHICTLVCICFSLRYNNTVTVGLLCHLHT